MMGYDVFVSADVFMYFILSELIVQHFGQQWLFEMCSINKSALPCLALSSMCAEHAKFCSL